MKEKPFISLELLLLNDLLNTKAIEEDIYEQALRRIEKIAETTATTNKPNGLLANA